MTVSGILSLSCPAPIRRYPQVVMGHGSGGLMMNELIEQIFVPAFGMVGAPGDGAVLEAPGGKLVYSTDSFVVRPLEFPGGDIGSLAVHGTVNDLVMMGARPLYLSAGFILEEGLEMELLRRVVASMGTAASKAGVCVVAGDTKVVERGHGDGLYINTSGIGVIEVECPPGPERARPGDRLLVSGTLGDHGVAILNARGELGLEADIESDSAALNGLVEAMQVACNDIHVLRDLTRGGLAAATNEIARASNVGLVLDETAIPVKAAVAGACEILGLDPFQVANEGKLLAIVSSDDVDAVLEAMRAHPLGKDAAIVGEVTEDHPGMVVGRTAIGGRRAIDMPAGELLPRIC